MKFTLPAVLHCGIAPCALAKPLKVFVLAGQSNMQGHAEVRTFDYGKDSLPTAHLRLCVHGVMKAPGLI